VSIVVECPHCESQFNLQPDLVGKSMRCPNNDCREIFVVQPKVATTAILPPVVPPPPPPVAEEEPLVPIFEGESVAVPDVAVPPPVKPKAPMRFEVESEPLVPILEGEAAAPPVAEPELVPVLVEDEVPEVVATVVEDGPKVVDWRKKVAPPPVAAEEKPEPKRVRRDEPESTGELVLPNRRGPGVWKYVLLALVAAILGVGAYAGIQSLINRANREKLLAEDAKKEFDLQNYTQAVKLYDQLKAEFPASDDKPKYEFFGKLSDVHTAVSAVTARDNPAEGQKKYDDFLKEYGDTPLAKPTDTGYGFDVFEAGRKLVEAYLGNADENLKNFVAGRKKRELLDAAEKAVVEGRKVLPVAERYRIKDALPLDTQRKRFDELSAKFVRERERLRVIDPYRDLAKDPTDQRIFEFAVALKQARFETDEEALQLITDAKAELRRLIRGVPDFRPPVPPPADPAGGLLFVSSPLGQSTLPVIVPPDAQPEVFFASVRGILYAFDPESGNLLWAARVGRAVRDVPVRVPERPGLPELALVPLDRDGFGLTARVARTGEVKWHQPLEAPIAGPPIVVNTRVYVPLKDDLGTVVEIEAGSGNRLSRIHLRQRIGPGGVRQPGSGTIFVAAEARRVFVINTEPFDAEGNRQPVQCVQVLATDHPDLSLRVPPVVTGPVAGEGRANRFLILAQADGTPASKLRAFPITPAEPVDAAVGPPEVAPPLAGAVAMPGHVLFPPHTDGERVAVVTDAGAFGLFGTNQPGNQDANIFAIPSASLPTDAKSPMPGQVISAEEDTFWAVSRSKLYRLRLGLTPGTGLQVNTAGLPLPAGVPIQVPQLNARREVALIVVRSDDSDGVRAMAFDPRDGRPRWQRKLGFAPQSRPIPQGQAATALADEDGGVYVLRANATDAAAKETAAIQSAWVVAPPVPAAVAPAQMCGSPDGKSVWVLIPERGEKESLRLRVRHVVDGKPLADELVQLPEKPAGPPTVSGNGVVFPCADGFLHRFEPGAAKLQQGPMWRGGEVPLGEPCFVSTISADEFLTTDGAKQVTRWRWATGADYKAVAGPWTMREKIPFAPVMVTLGGTEQRLFVADPSGNVWMYDADAVADPIRRWRAGKDDPDNPIPAGKPTTGFVVGTTAAGVVVTYLVENRHVVAIAPGSEKALWVVRRLGSADILGGVPHGTAFLFTDIAGIVTAYDQLLGEKLGSIRSENQDLLPRTVAIPVGNGKSLLVPMLDGSVVMLPNPGN
jgi:hypothetical protein